MNKTYYNGSDKFEFIFNDLFPSFNDFDILSVSELCYGYDDNDELSIFPSSVKIEVSDFDWNNYHKFLDNKPFFANGHYNLVNSIEIKYNNSSLGVFIIDSVEQNVSDYCLTITLTSACEYFKKLRIDNPYLIIRLMQLGHLEPELLRVWNGSTYEPTNGYAFGGIAHYYPNSPIPKGFLIKPYSNSDPRGVIELWVFETLVQGDPNESMKIGSCSIYDLMLESLKLLNPSISLEIIHNWTFGSHNKSITDLYIYDIYKYVFGRILIIGKNVWDSLHPNKWSNPSLSNICEQVFEDENYIVFKVNYPNTRYPGMSSRLISDFWKLLCKNFYAIVLFKDINNVIFSKKGLYNQIQLSHNDILKDSFKVTSEINKKSYVCINWQNSQYATRGSQSADNSDNISYEIIFSASAPYVATIVIPGLPGWHGSYSQILTLPANGNLFYYHNDNVYFAVQVYDSGYLSNINQLVELIAESEYMLNYHNRSKIEIALDGLSYDYNKIYTYYLAFNQYLKFRPITLKKNYIENKTEISAIETI